MSNLTELPGHTIDLLLETLPMMAWIANTDLHVTWARGGAMRMLALECLLPSAVDAIVGKAHPLVAAHEVALAGGMRDVDVEWMGRSYETRVQPLRDDAGTIIGCIGSAHDVTELKRAERKIVWQSRYDALTGALNRNYFAEKLEMLLTHARPAERRVGVLVIDVDDFHAVNAMLGNSAGDKVLRNLVRRLLEVVPGDALIGRIDGDEIAIALFRSPAEELRLLCDEIHARLDEPFVAGDKELRLQVSIGTATFPFDGRSPEHLLRSAKAATRRANQLGGPTRQPFFQAFNFESSQRVELDNSLRNALERDEFFLVYQPQIRLEDRSIQGLEVLLRWRKDGDVLPAWSFIPRLEESQLMIPIGHWIIDRALAQLGAWRAQGLEIGSLAINVSARQLSDESLVPHFQRTLSLYDIPPPMLDIEITETTAVQNVEVSGRILDELRALGINITIDDFGTGYSSLNYLQRFTITGLKIDRTFVSDLPGSRAGTAIVESMIATANALDLRLIAEGVETEEQSAWLMRAGCRAAQGFLFSKPISAEEVPDFARQHRAGR